MAGHFLVEWDHVGRVPVDLLRGTWRLNVQYARLADMPPGQLDVHNGEQLWEKTDVVSSQVATVDFEVVDWDGEALEALGEQISQASADAARIALHGQVEAVWPLVEEALFNTERLPVGPNCEFRQAAVRYMAAAPFPEASRILLETARRCRNQFEQLHLMNSISYTLASFPYETVGPWAVDLFNNAEDRRMRDLALRVLKYRRYETDDPGVIGHVQRIVAEEIRNVMTDSEARHFVDICVALGAKNTRPILAMIYGRIKGTTDPRWVRLKEDIEELLAQEDKP